MMTPDEMKDRVLAWARAHPLAVVAVEDDDGKGALLVERGSGKELRVRWGALSALEEKSSSLRPHPYLVLLFEDGRQIALADVGFAFAPSTVNSGPLPELPATLCFRDLRHLLAGAVQALENHDRAPEALRAVLAAIALLDGARAAGFEVGREEREVEAVLALVEERR